MYGSVQPSDVNTCGTQVQYNCSAGFELNGEEFSNCTESGLWTGGTRNCSR